MRYLKKTIILVMIVGFISGFGCAALAAGRERDSSQQRHTLIHDGARRHYIVRASHKLALRNGRAPLVLVLHGGGGNAANAERMTGFTAKAEKEGFIVVYPEGSGRLDGQLLTWNAGHCCGYAMEKQVDDVAFISALIDRLSEDYPVDPTRIYVTGMSNGGMMTHRLGIELSHKLAAIAPVVATLFGDEKRPEYPVSAIMLNGMLDESVPYQGGPPGGRFSNAWDGTPARPALDQEAFWANADECTAPESSERDAFILWQSHCPAGRGVELYLLKDNGHAWPGGRQGSRRGDKPGSALNGTDVIWEFFTSHSK